MPWRRTRAAWPVWVSEVMLQQTQVATATPYWERFMARFPRPADCAAAPLADVLALWAGLGYYRRARALHAAAQVVVREHGGEVPLVADAFAALPGVGRYTTAAVMSIAARARLAVLDGNVSRVLARWHARAWQVRVPADARALWDAAQAAMPAGRTDPGEWNQAMMELGALVCVPRGPRCDACPVAAWCAARAQGRAEAYPPPAARRATERQRRAIAWIERGGRVLMTQRRGALLDGLWEPPGAELRDGEDAAAALLGTLRALGVRAAVRDSGVRVRHTITHRAIEVEVWRGRAGGAKVGRADVRYLAPGGDGPAQTALVRKAARAVRDADGEGGR